MTGELDTAEFRDALVAGNDAAWTLLIASTCDAVRLAARGVGATGLDVEDAALETYARALKAGKSFAEVDCFQAWLARVAIRVVVDNHRARTRHTRIHRDRLAPLDKTEHRELGTATPSTRTDEQDRLAHLMKGLSLLEHEVITLRYLGGYTAAEIAQLLVVSERTVNKRLLKAMGQLRKRGESKGRGRNSDSP